MRFCKLFVTISLLLHLDFSSKAQSIIVGDTLSNNIVYKNIKDSIIGSMSGNSTVQADFDLDSDNVMDVSFKIIRSISPGHTAIEQKIFSLNNLEFVFITSMSGYADTLALNSQINAGLNWGNSINGLYLYNLWYSGGNTLVNGNFLYPNNYLGFRKISAIDTVYGWILVDGTYLSHNRIKVRSWAFENKSAIGIAENYISNKLSVYPNPTSSAINITYGALPISEIEIINTLGQTVINQSYSKYIDVNFLPNGIYTLKVSTDDNRIFLSKFIKE